MSRDAIMGSVFKVDGTWYIRLLHGGGNLTRLEGAAAALEALRDGDHVQIDGYVSSDHLGCPQACHARAITVIRGKQESSNR